LLLAGLIILLIQLTDNQKVFYIKRMEINVVKGDIELIRNGESVNASVGEGVVLGDLIRTKEESYVELHSEKETVLVGENTEIIFEGIRHSFNNKYSSNKEFQVEPASMGVRGSGSYFLNR
ncbi:hypothetical protein AB4Z22_42105, partial [Paenibacillus sp. TAF58]